MQILENNLRFSGGFRNRPYTKRIVVHHSASASTTTIEDIHSWHLQRNWAGVGYHYVIYPDGTIYRGRPEWARGAHAWQDEQHEANTDGLGICLVGDFMIDQPAEAQMQSLVWLIHDIWIRYPGLPVIGHKNVMATACPGELFPWGELRKRLEGPQVAEPWKEKIIDDVLKAGLITERHNPDDTATKWFVLAVALNLLKIVKGGR